MLAKRAFRVESVLPRQAMLEHIRLVMGCSANEAISHLHDPEAAGLLFIRGTGTSELVYPAHLLDASALRSHSVDVKYGLGHA